MNLLSKLFRRVVLPVAVVFAVVNLGFAADWTRFRGPNGLGVSSETGIPTTWNREENIVWKMPLSSDGNGSPIVSNGRVFIASANKKGTERSLICFDRKDGKQLWVKAVPFATDEPTHNTNPFGASTPTSDGKRVVVWHGSAGLFCYDFDGTKLWSNDLGDVHHIWGYGSSPVLLDGTVLLNFGPGDQTFLAAVDLESGKTRWTTEESGGNNDRNGRMVGSWSTPIVAKVGGKTQILCSMPTRVNAYDPKDGKVIWSCEGLSGRNGDLVYTSPIISDNIGVAMGGYTGPGIGFKLGGSGDITKSARLWHDTKPNPQRIGSGLIVGNYIYIASEPGIGQCLELDTGNVVWETRLQGGKLWGAIVMAEGLMYVTNQQGTTLVFRPNPEKFELVESNPLNERTNATPAISDGQIFIRTFKHLYCIGTAEK